jgi:hypothetical protein
MLTRGLEFREALNKPPLNIGDGFVHCVQVQSSCWTGVYSMSG